MVLWALKDFNGPPFLGDGRLGDSRHAVEDGPPVTSINHMLWFMFTVTRNSSDYQSLTSHYI